jgi:hypothetical protein
MATVFPYARASQADSALAVIRIEDVEAGDRIDFRTIFGRPAKAVQVTLTDAADEMVFLLNNRRSVHGPVPERSDGVTVYASATQETLARQINRRDVFETGPEFTFVGEVYQSPDNLPIEILEIVDLTLSTGAVIEVVAW